MIKITTLIPLYRNGEPPVRAPKDEIEDILDEIYDHFGGYTVEGRTRGRWLDQETGLDYRDLCLKVSVAIEESRLAEAEMLVAKIGKQLGQIEMFFEIHPTTVKFLKSQ